MSEDKPPVDKPSEGKEIDEIRAKVAEKQEIKEKRKKLAEELNDIYMDKDGNVCQTCQKSLQGIVVGQPGNKTDYVLGIRVCKKCNNVEDFITHPSNTSTESVELGTSLKKKGEEYLEQLKQT